MSIAPSDPSWLQKVMKPSLAGDKKLLSKKSDKNNKMDKKSSFMSRFKKKK